MAASFNKRRYRGLVLIYYITDRSQFAGTDAERRARLLRTIREAAAAGVDYIQLREKDLCMRELELWAREIVLVIRAAGSSRLLINHRTDVALAVGADGVQLAGSDIAASEARALAAEHNGNFLVAASCHSAQEVRLAEAQGADFAILAPIFEKPGVVRNGIGLGELRRASHKDRDADLRPAIGDTPLPVFALGGVDLERAQLCAAAGATGIAGIRLFQNCLDLPALVRSIRLL